MSTRSRRRALKRWKPKNPDAGLRTARMWPVMQRMGMKRSRLW